VASIDKRPDGKYRARWRETPNGPQRSKTFARKVDATAHLAKVTHQQNTGTYIATDKAKVTVAEYYPLWAARQPWRDSSRSSVGSMFRNHVLPAFGERPLGSVRRGDVESWAAGLPGSPRWAGLAVQYLGTMYAAALDDGLVAFNPCQRAKRPRVDDGPVVPYTAEEYEALRDAAPGWFQVAFTFGRACGLRYGEGAGMTVDRLDFLPGRCLTVDRQLVTPWKGEPSFGPPKSARSYRTVPLADVALEELAHHLEVFGTGENGLVLHENGRPVRRQRFGAVWRQIRQRAGLGPEAVFHRLRHTYASTLLSGGVSVAAVAEYLGNTPAVLLRTYAHLIPADHDRARSVVQAAFSFQLDERQAQ
jgi:integrase